MNQSKIVSFLFVLLGFLVVVGSVYFVMSYGTDILRAIVDFVTDNDLSKLKQCGVVVPTEFNRLKIELTTVVLPFLYLGIPLLLLVVSALMFFGGFYYHKARMADDSRMKEELEREMIRKLVRKMESEKPAKRGERFSGGQAITLDEKSDPASIGSIGDDEVG